MRWPLPWAAAKCIRVGPPDFLYRAVKILSLFEPVFRMIQGIAAGYLALSRLEQTRP